MGGWNIEEFNVQSSEFIDLTACKLAVILALTPYTWKRKTPRSPEYFQGIAVMTRSMAVGSPADF
jgi:hypothetical protein